VAVAALLATAAVVGVVLGVTVEAFRRWRLEGLVFMAPGTLGFRMFADQREAGRVVIELDVGPGYGAMTVAAFRPHGVAMNIVGLVAGETLRRRIAVLSVFFVALRALGFAVLAQELEVGEIVVERAFIEMDDIGIPAFMVCMTARTAVIARIAEQSVKPRPIAYVGRDIFMTFEAERTLLCALELGVTCTAVFLVFAMTFNNTARHDQGLNLGIGRFGNDEGKCHQGSGE